jgi:hypothetical protein
VHREGFSCYLHSEGFRCTVKPRLAVCKIDHGTHLPGMSVKAKNAINRLDQKYSGTGNVKYDTHTHKHTHTHLDQKYSGTSNVKYEK